jgi:lysophospholipase L1-like esterase
MNLRTALLLAPVLTLLSQAADPVLPDRFEKDIAAFEAVDRDRPPQPGGVLFVGSSSIRLWKTLATDFPGLPVVNRGFGGSHISDCVHFFDRVVLPHRPRVVVFYCGGNDLAGGKPPEEVAADFRSFTARLHATLPEARIVVNSIKITPSRWKLREPIAFANTLLAAHCAGDPRRFFLDLNRLVITPEGQPREDLYVEDRLHLNPAGYAVWREALAPPLMNLARPAGGRPEPALR